MKRPSNAGFGEHVRRIHGKVKERLGSPSPPPDRPYNTEKATGYSLIYNNFLKPLRKRHMYLLELGIDRGESCRYFLDSLPLTKIVGVDIALSKEVIKRFSDENRVQLVQGNQADLQFLSRISHEAAESGYDIIVDDASHLGYETKVSFWHLFNHHLKPGGLYFIEDWGTGYWDDYPDGRLYDFDADRRDEKGGGVFYSHANGMVGFVKQLVDEVGASDATRGRFRGKAKRKSKFASMAIFPGVVVIRKDKE